MKKINNFYLGSMLIVFSINIFATNHENEITEPKIKDYIDNKEQSLNKKENTQSSEINSNKYESIAKTWVEAFYSDRDAFSSVVEEHLASNGRNVGSRYVGFGFTFNQNEDPGKMVVSSVIPNSPASEVLKQGDEFISVNGLRVNESNMGKLAFRGKPGEEVRAIIKRDGKTKKVSVARGTIAGSFSKEQVLNNISLQNSEDWSPIDSNIVEILSRENIVYVLHWAKRIDNISKLPFEAYTVTRFVFNENGEIDRYGFLSEDRFVLEQQGYKISR